MIEADPTQAFGPYARQSARLGTLPALQRRLHSAANVGELLAWASVEGALCCGFTRGVILALADGRLTSGGMEAIDDPACDALRRRSLAEPIPLLPGSEEAEMIRRAEGLRRGRPVTSSVTKDALQLDEYVLAAVVPESRAVALVVLDRPGPPVNDDDRAAADLFAHLLGLAITRVVLRLRMHELSTELRHLTASAHALMHEAQEAPIMLTTDYGHGPIFTTAGPQAAALPSNFGNLLSQREQEIAALMISGRSNREIGEELHLSPDTVKAHVARLARKLGASNRVEAVARYVDMSRPTRS